MAIHFLHLNPEALEYIRSGQKTIENRLFDEKRRTYKVGDSLFFISTANADDLVEAVIIKLHKERSFRELFLNKNTIGKYSTPSTNELLDRVSLFYSEKDQEKYGVVGIEFQLIK
ncbi:MAG: ASCH domain-containing protein [Patescibacteria group bacterium]